MSENYAVRYSPKAMDDLRAIYTYIAEHLQVPETAKKQVNRIREAIRSLDTMPSRYALVDWEPWRRIGMHKVAVDHYVVYYVVNSDRLTVQIIRIFYGGRDAEAILQSEINKK